MAAVAAHPLPGSRRVPVTTAVRIVSTGSASKAMTYQATPTRQRSTPLNSRPNPSRPSVAAVTRTATPSRTNSSTRRPGVTSCSSRMARHCANHASGMARTRNAATGCAAIRERMLPRRACAAGSTLAGSTLMGCLGSRSTSMLGQPPDESVGLRELGDPEGPDHDRRLARRHARPQDLFHIVPTVEACRGAGIPVAFAAFGRQHYEVGVVLKLWTRRCGPCGGDLERDPGRGGFRIPGRATVPPCLGNNLGDLLGDVDGEGVLLPLFQRGAFAP